MTDKPDGKHAGWVLAVAVFAAYVVAYFATYKPYSGPKVGIPPWYQHTIGGWMIPYPVARVIFAPAHWVDEKLRPREGID